VLVHSQPFLDVTLRKRPWRKLNASRPDPEALNCLFRKP
jgi:hypothetical protein